MDYVFRHSCYGICCFYNDANVQKKSKEHEQFMFRGFMVGFMMSYLLAVLGGIHLFCLSITISVVVLMYDRRYFRLAISRGSRYYYF